jgi:ABC-type transporter Mla subunit MlaD
MTDQEIRSTLATIFENLKENQDALSNVMDQLTSLRDVLKEASPGFSEAFEDRLQYWQSLNADLRADSNRTYNMTIRLLRGQ